MYLYNIIIINLWVISMSFIIKAVYNCHSMLSMKLSHILKLVRNFHPLVKSQ